MDILLATRNPGKITELRQLIGEIPVNLRGLDEFPELSDVEETGTTFVENARLKASEYAKRTGLFALADDSGLEVLALNNAPGVFSARYGGANSSYAAKISKLLKELNASENTSREARFRCVMAFSDRSGNILTTTEGICAGQIAETPAGENGFGYDPVFIPNGFEETFGELSEAIKQSISHRAQAVSKIIDYLRAFTSI